jgi:bacteriorhodopsin
MAEAWWRSGRTSGRAWLWGAFALSLAGVVFLLAVPTSTLLSVDSLGNTSTHHLRVWQSEGWSVLWLLSVPLILPAIALLANRREVTIVAAALLTVGVVLAAMSIGIFFLPAAVALVLAALRLRHGRMPA